MFGLEFISKCSENFSIKIKWKEMKEEHHLQEISMNPNLSLYMDLQIIFQQQFLNLMIFSTIMAKNQIKNRYDMWHGSNKGNSLFMVGKPVSSLLETIKYFSSSSNLGQ